MNAQDNLEFIYLKKNEAPYIKSTMVNLILYDILYLNYKFK